MTRSVTPSLWLCHLPLLLQIKAQGCRKSTLHSVLSSKSVADVAQLKQKAQTKKNLSGSGSRDKELSPCNSNRKHGHRGQGTNKAESRRESGGQSDTGRYQNLLDWVSLLFFNVVLCCMLLSYFNMICLIFQQPVWTVAHKKAGLDWSIVVERRHPGRWSKVHLSREQRVSMTEKVPHLKVTPQIKVSIITNITALDWDYWAVSARFVPIDSIEGDCYSRVVL